MIDVYPDLESLSRAAAALLVKQANLAVAARGRFSVALSGGATPRRTYELLAAPPLVDQAPWDRVHVFWGRRALRAPKRLPGATPAWRRKPGWTTCPSPLTRFTR